MPFPTFELLTYACLTVSGVAARKQPLVKTVALKARLIPSPGRWTGPGMITPTYPFLHFVRRMIMIGSF